MKKMFAFWNVIFIVGCNFWLAKMVLAANLPQVLATSLSMYIFLSSADIYCFAIQDKNRYHTLFFFDISISLSKF